MESDLDHFVNANHETEAELDAHAHFVYRQIVNQAGDCLQRSREMKVTSVYFDEMSANLQRLLKEVCACLVVCT